MLTKVKIMAGACGYSSVVKIDKTGKMTIKIEIITACKALRSMNEDLKHIDCSKDVFVKMVDSSIYKLASRKLRHTDCPVPAAIVKGIQVELGGAIAKDVIIRFQKCID